MEVLLTYDVNTVKPEGRQRLRKIAKLCEGYGLRVQKSVFEIICTEPDLLTLLDRIGHVIKDTEDSIRIYQLPFRTLATVRTLGTAQPTPHRDPLIL